MARSKIEWLARPGTIPESWNPIGGCSPISEGCRNCYAARMARRLRRFPLYEGTTDIRGWTGKVNFDIYKRGEPHRWRKPRTVFVCSMSDLFHPDVPDWFIGDVLVMMAQTQDKHTYIVLTKRPERMRERWGRYPLARDFPKIWLGVTAENQKAADERIPVLLQVPAAVRFVSCEPLLEPIDLGQYLWDGTDSWLGIHEADIDICPLYYNGCNCSLQWVIVGAETGPGARYMNPDWARAILAQCRPGKAPFFMKKMSKGVPIPADLMVREWPDA